MLQLHLGDQQFYCLLRYDLYQRGLKVSVPYLTFTANHRRAMKCFSEYLGEKPLCRNSRFHIKSNDTCQTKFSFKGFNILQRDFCQSLTSDWCLTHCGLVTPCEDIDRSWSILAQVMPCCHMVPSHTLKQCLFLINKVLWHLPESNSTDSIQTIILYNDNEPECYTSKIIAISLTDQWVNAKTGYVNKSP